MISACFSYKFTMLSTYLDEYEEMLKVAEFASNFYSE